jgi:hypothetical protein
MGAWINRTGALGVSYKPPVIIDLLLNLHHSNSSISKQDYTGMVTGMTENTFKQPGGI